MTDQSNIVMCSSHFVVPLTFCMVIKTVHYCDKTKLHRLNNDHLKLFHFFISSQCACASLLYIHK